jgi:hypothetical protein
MASIHKEHLERHHKPGYKKVQWKNTQNQQWHYLIFAVVALLTMPTILFIDSLSIGSRSIRDAIARRDALISLVSFTAASNFGSTVVWAEDDVSVPIYSYESRDRKGNQQAVIRDDYWYVTGKLPPRLLQSPLKGDDPQWNAFGSCTTSESTGTNSCTYVSLNQRRSAYSKYASSIAYGATEYDKLGSILQSIQKSVPASQNSQQLWQNAEALLKQDESTPPPAVIDAELKMVLFATGMLTSPNFSGPSRELLVARFYANEVRFAHREILEAVRERNIDRAIGAWEFGRDSWNSYFQSVARSIVSKVGEAFVAI